MRITLTQAEADALLAMEKFFVDINKISFPVRGTKMVRELKSADERETFMLDIYRGRLDLRKFMFQNRARKTIKLARLDFVGTAHRNADDSIVPRPHLHLYREGYGDLWAFPIPENLFAELGNPYQTLAEFMQYCNIVEPPPIQHGLPE